MSARRTFIIAALTAGVVAAPATAAPVPVPGETEVLESGSAPVKLVAQPDGTTLGVWSESNGPVRFIRRPPGGVWGPSTVLSQVAAADAQKETRVQTAVDGAGNVAVVWSHDGSDPGVRMRTIAQDGTLGAQVDVADVASPEELRVVASADGAVAVLWTDKIGGENHLLARVRPSQTAAFATQNAVSVHTAATDWVNFGFGAAFDPDGGLVIVYSQLAEPGAGFQERVRLRRRTPAGTLTAVQDLSDDTTDEDADASKASVAVDAAGMARIVWDQLDTAGNNHRVRTRTRTVEGGLSGIATLKGDATFQTDPFVGIDPAQNTTVVFQDTFNALGLVRAFFKPAAGVFGTVQSLSDPDYGYYATTPGRLLRDAAGNEAVPFVGTKDGVIRLSFAWRAAGSTEFGPPVDTAANYPTSFGGFFFEATGDPAGNLTFGVTHQETMSTYSAAFAYADNDGPPDLAGLGVPATGAIGQALGFGVTATDWSGVASVGWVFSDGASAPGASVSHAYGAAGAFTATATATDLTGQSASASGNTTVSSVPTATASPTATPTATPDAEPDSDITGLKKSVRRGKLKSIRGTATDDKAVTRVDVAVVKLDGGARAAAKRCRILTASGTLRSRSAPKGRCAATGFLRATLSKGSWTLKLSKRLPAGRYAIYSRATDSAGHTEKTFSVQDRNRALLNVIR